MKISWIPIIILFFLLSGCNEYKIESIFKNREIVIDGNDGDWQDAKYYIKKHDVVFGVMNDNDYLYLCFYPTTSELTRQTLSQGLTLWINNQGKKNDDYGIRFVPVDHGFLKNERPERSNHDKGQLEIDPGQIAKLMPTKLEIIGPGKDQITTFEISKLKGVEIGLNFEKELLAYELKIPLNDDPDYSVSIGTVATSKIAIGFEVPKPDIPEKNEENREMERPSMDGGQGSRPGGGPGGGGGMSRGSENSRDDQQNIEKLELWSIIQLVEN